MSSSKRVVRDLANKFRADYSVRRPEVVFLKSEREFIEASFTLFLRLGLLTLG
jgi:hypothetical protein